MFTQSKAEQTEICWGEDKCNSSPWVILAVDTVKPEEEYQDVFKGIGLFPGEHHIKIDETVSPVINPPRRIPQALHSRVKDELNRMEKLQIVAKVDEPTAGSTLL